MAPPSAATAALLLTASAVVWAAPASPASPEAGGKGGKGGAAGRPVSLDLLRHPHRSAQPHWWKTWSWAVEGEAGSPVSLPISGNYAPFGVFYTQISLGSPPQIFNVAIDTGSYRTIVTDVDCPSCNATSKRAFHAYDPSASATSKQLKGFSNSYKTCNLKAPSETCTIRGTVYNDVFQLGPYKGSINFGAITSQTDNFMQFEYIHGLMGMDSIGGTDNFEGPSPVQAAFGGANLYAFCFSNNGGGKLTIGDVDDSLHMGTLQYTPLEWDVSLSVEVDSIKVGNHSISMRATDATLDSGTTLLLLPNNLFAGIRTAAASLPGAGDLFSGKCAVVDPAAYPDIRFQLKGVELVLPPSRYLLPEDGGVAGSLCLGIVDMGRGPSAMFIIGDTVLAGYYTVYDRKQGRIGWAPVHEDNCFGSHAEAAANNTLVV